jgi:polyphosphate kinase 2
VVALPAPSDRQKTQWYPQRYIEHFPAAGEVVIFDRSWYNRAGVERVMGFCSEDESEHFLEVCPRFEQELIREGIHLIKYFFDVSREEQERRFLARATDPMRHWKLSPMDVESWRRWWDYTAAYQRMLEATDTRHCPWYRIQADDKRRARLNCISHLLSLFDYDEQGWKPPKLGKRKARKSGTPEELIFKHTVPLVY